jgi:hypothetical protein
MNTFFWFSTIATLLLFVGLGALLRRIHDGAGMFYAYTVAVGVAVFGYALSEGVSPQRDLFIALVIPATLAGCLYSSQLQQLLRRVVHD